MQKFTGTFTVLFVLAASLAIITARQSAARAELSSHYETATFSGGCFWGLQETLRDIPGVIKTTVGYTGGAVINPTSEMVAAGRTGHAEAVEVVFDPAQLTYERLVTDFLILHNPTRQPSSAGSSSRSGIFYHSEAQRQAAVRVKDKINDSGKWSSPVTTEITPATPFYAAEEYHQDYYRKNAGRMCSLSLF